MNRNMYTALLHTEWESIAPTYSKSYTGVHQRLSKFTSRKMVMLVETINRGTDCKESTYVSYTHLNLSP